MGNLEVAVGLVVVADEAMAIGSDGRRRELAHIACLVYGAEDGRCADGIGAVGYLQVTVGGIVIANEGQAVGPDSHGVILPHIASTIHGGPGRRSTAVSYTHLRAHETPEHLVCR